MQASEFVPNSTNMLAEFTNQPQQNTSTLESIIYDTEVTNTFETRCQDQNIHVTYGLKVVSFQLPVRIISAVRSTCAFFTSN